MELTDHGADTFGQDFPTFARAILDRLPDAVTVQAADGTLVYANRAAAELTGFDDPELMLAAGGRAAADAFETTNTDGSPLDLAELPGRRALAGEDAPEPIVLRAVHKETGRLSWTRTQATPIHDEDGVVRYVVNLIEDFTEQKRGEIRQRILADAGSLLSGTPDPERTLREVAELAVPELAEWCAFDVVDGRGGVRLAAVAHADPGKIALAYELRAQYPPEIKPDTGIGKALRGEIDHYPEIPEELLVQSAQSDEHLRIIREVGLRSAIVVPVRSGGEILGALTLVDGTRALTEADVELAEELGRRAGDALATARAFQQQVEVARTLEQALMPPRLPDKPGWEFTTLFSPAPGARVGGDFYDMYFVPGGWWLVIGDVAGRGAAAAALTSVIRYTLRTAGQLTNDLTAAAEQVNHALGDQSNRRALCSLAAISVETDGPVQVLCAGHPPLALIRENDVEWIEPTGPILGAFADANWGICEPLVEPGDGLLLYTDGVTEAEGADGRFGEERLGDLLRRTGAKDGVAVIGALRSSIDEWAKGRTDDDIAAVYVRRIPGD